MAGNVVIFKAPTSVSGDLDKDLKGINKESPMIHDTSYTVRSNHKTWGGRGGNIKSHETENEIDTHLAVGAQGNLNAWSLKCG